MQCEAAVNALCIFVGWLVPTYFTLRRCHEQVLQQRAEGLGFGSGGQALEPAVSADSPQHSGSSIGSSRGGLSPLPSSPPSQASPPTQRLHGRWRACLQLAVNDAVAWVLENVFLEGAPPGLAPMAWWILAVLIWMAGCMLAILAS